MKNVATWMREKDVKRFQDSVAFDPEVRLWDARAEEIPWDQIQGLLLTGGEDISKEYLNQPGADFSVLEDSDPARDAWEFPAVARAVEKRLPILGVCRGHQVLNVALGGTLLLHIPGHAEPELKNQEVQQLRYVVENPVFRIEKVNSSHHQAIDRLGDGLKVEAVHEGDEIIEQVRRENYEFCVGVQYHPEKGPVYRALFEAFVSHLK